MHTRAHISAVSFLVSLCCSPRCVCVIHFFRFVSCFALCATYDVCLRHDILRLYMCEQEHVCAVSRALATRKMLWKPKIIRPNDSCRCICIGRCCCCRRRRGRRKNLGIFQLDLCASTVRACVYASCVYKRAHTQGQIILWLLCSWCPSMYLLVSQARSERANRCLFNLIIKSSTFSIVELKKIFENMLSQRRATIPRSFMWNASSQIQLFTPPNDHLNDSPDRARIR